MNIPAAELKSTLKKLAAVRSETFTIGDHGISAKDSDVWVVAESPLSQLGSFTVVGKKLTQVVNRMSGTVSLDLADNKLTLKSSKAEIVLEAKPAKRPLLPTFPVKTVEIPAADFKKALLIAMSSVGANKSAEFGGVVEFKSWPTPFDSDRPEGYRLAGTDGGILAVLNQPMELPFEIKTLLNLTACSIFQIMENKITYGEGEKGPYLKSGPLTVYVSKSSQKYPDINPLLAQQSVVSFKFNPGEWLEAFKTIEPVIEPVVNEVGRTERQITLHFLDGVVQFSSSGTGATARDESVFEQILPDPLLEPKEMTLVVEADHFSEFLSKATEEATLGFSRMDKPLMLESGSLKVLTFPRKGSKK